MSLRRGVLAVVEPKVQAERVADQINITAAVGTVTIGLRLAASVTEAAP